MTEFTKGEWKLREYQAMSLIEVDKGATTICEISGEGNADNCDITLNKEQRANANLIAVAPDMYEFIDSLIGHGLVYGGDIYKAMELLAKARGE